MKNLVMITGIAVLLIGSAARDKSQNVTPNGTLSGAGATVPQFSLKITSGGGTVYDSAVPGSVAGNLVAGTYTLNAVPANGSNTGITYVAVLTQVDAVTTPTPIEVALTGGSGSVTLPPGTYSIAITATNTASNTAYAPVLFSANVVCANPTALNVDASKMSVSGGNNVYNYDATGAASGGQPPYRYAWDYTGDGSQDSQFSASPASSTVNENYIGNRSSIGLIVKDSCNTTKSVTASLQIPIGSLASLAPGGGVDYIHGNVTSATGLAASYKDVMDGGTGVNYYATNNAAADPIHAVPSINGTAFTFVIASDKFTYGLPSSVAFGMNLSMGNITATLGSTVQTTTFDVSAAQLSSITFTTEQVGDGMPTDKLAGGYPKCTLSNVVVKVLQVTGVPCAPGTTNAKWNNQEMHWTIEGGADYTCTGMTDANGSQVAMTGDFDGTNDLIDSCVGGGGQGGGGDQPPQF